MTDKAAFIKNLSRKRGRFVREAEDTIGLGHFVNLYNDPAHFVYEVAQNAEDTGASCLRIEIGENRVTVAHDGKDFDCADVESITKIALTSKGGTEQIGKFGIGFKSVFALTDQPEIHSGGFHFAIKKMIIPFSIAPEGDGQHTLIALPLKSDSRAIIGSVEERMNYLFGAPEDVLLFLAKIRQFRMRWGGRTDDVVLCKDETFSHSGENMRARVAVISGGADGEKRFRVFRRMLRQGVIEVAYLSTSDSNDGEQLTPEDNPPVAVYFPTGSRPDLSFRMHIPYAPDSSRQSINYGDKSNAELTAQAALLVADTLPLLRDEGLLSASFIRDILPNVSELSQSATLDSMNPACLRLAIARAIKEKFESGEKLLPAVNGGHVSATDAILGMENLHEFLSEEDARELWKRGQWIDAGLRGNPLISALGIPQINLRNFAQTAENEFFQRRDDRWLTRFYGALADKFPHGWRANPSASEPLSYKAFIRLENGNCVAPFDSKGRRQVYLPGGHKSFPAVKQTFLDDERSQKFLRDTLGLRAPTLRDVVAKVIAPRYPEGKLPDVDEKAHAEHMRAILEVADDPQIGDSLRNRPLIKIQTPRANRLEFRRPADCYFSNKRTDDWFADTKIPFVDEKFYKKLLGTKWPKSLEFFARLGVAQATFANVVEKIIAPCYLNRTPEVDEKQHIDHMGVIIKAMGENPEEVAGLLEDCPIVKMQPDTEDAHLKYCKPLGCFFPSERMRVWFATLGMEVYFADVDFYERRLPREWREHFARIGVAEDIGTSDFDKGLAVLLRPDGHGRMTPPLSKIVWEIAVAQCQNTMALERLTGYSWLFDKKDAPIRKDQHGEFSLSDLECAGYPDCHTDRARIVADIIGLKREGVNGGKPLPDVVPVPKDEYAELQRKAAEYDRLHPTKPETKKDLPPRKTVEIQRAKIVTPSNDPHPETPHEITGSNIVNGDEHEQDGDNEKDVYDSGEIGRRAEEYAKEYLEDVMFPGHVVESGNEDGRRSVGYDLRVIRPGQPPLFVEVKGKMSEKPSNVDITNAQWKKACQCREGENYWIMVIARVCEKDPKPIILKNPAEAFANGNLYAHPVRIRI